VWASKTHKWTFFMAEVTAVPIFLAQRVKEGVGWPYNILALAQHIRFLASGVVG